MKTILLVLACSVLSAQAMEHKAVFTTPPKKTPANEAIDAPLLGNGDTLVALGGGPARLQFYINKNDLWVLAKNGGAQPRPLARLDLALPGLQGASYHVEQDLARAITTGRFEKDGTTLALETGVAATENLLWVKLSAAGGSLAGKAALVVPGVGDATVAALVDRGEPLNVGREQYQGGRWYFNGEMAGLLVTNAVLPGAVTGRPESPEAFDGKKTWREWAVPKMGKTVSVAAWVRSKDQSQIGYIVSKGEWSRAYSLGLSSGRLRWAVAGDFVETEQPLPANEWVYVVGTFNEGVLRLYVNGQDVDARKPSGTTRVGDVQMVAREFTGNGLIPAGASCAARVVNGGEEFTVEPGKPVILVVATASRFETNDFRAAAIQRVTGFRADDLPAVQRRHEAWWRAFWGKSFVEIPDQVLEQRYYLSQYVMASASRAQEFPPGLFGWVTTDRPRWNGTYFLNYNFFAPFYGLYAANHIEQADPCSHPICHVAERFAHDPSVRTPGTEGIYQGRTIGPLGSCGAAGRPFSTPQRSSEQKSNGGYACVPLAMQWYATYDRDFAKRAYPYVKGVATFWEHWLKYEEGRYVDYDDPCHEESGPDMNPLVSLAFVKMVMNLALEMSTELRVDADRRTKWEHIRDHLSAFPTQQAEDGTTVFRYAEKGTAWWANNTVGIQHIYPAGGIGLDSSPELLETSRNMIRVMSRWEDFNGMNSFYAAAARVGYDPHIILKEMRAMVGRLGLPNGMIAGNPHGMEHLSIVPNAIQEMLLQSHEGVLRFFPCWPKDRDARFGTLRARGAFLVSAELKGGVVGGVKIVSEKGRDLTVLNPWTGQRQSFKTRPGEAIELKADD